MQILDISYSVWTAVFSSFGIDPPLHHVYGGSSGTHVWVHIYFGYDGKIFRSEITGSDETNWSSNYSSSSTERASDDDAVAMIVKEGIDYPDALIGFRGALSSVVSGVVSGLVSTSATTQAIVRNTTYTSPTVVRGRSIRSADVNDTSAGTGARTVRITYLRDDYTGPYTEDVTLNGTTWVNTSATNIMYVEMISVITVGSGGQNAGAITLNDNTGGTGATICSIAVGDNKLFMCHHWVATGRTCAVLNLAASGDGVGGRMMVKWTPLPMANAAQIEIINARVPPAQQQSLRPMLAPPILTGPGLLAAYIRPAGAGAATFYASIDFYER